MTYSDITAGINSDPTAMALISTALFLVSLFVWNKGISNYESAGS